jgi:integrase
VVLVPLKGVHVVRARLKSGVVEYHYAWRGGPRLKGKPGSQEYVASFHAAMETRKAPTTGDVRSLIVAFKASPEFAKLGDHTKRAYRKYLDMIEAEWGDAPLAVLDDPDIGAEFDDWRDTMADTPRAADYAVGTLKRLLAWGIKKRRFNKTNQAEKIERLHTADRSESIWTEDDFKAFAQVASDELRWAVELAALSGLRQSDLISLTWNQYDGETIQTRTSKAGKFVTVPVTKACRSLMEQITKRHLIVLTTERGGRPWTADGLRSSFRKACAKARVKRTFHDLRRTAATNLLRAGVGAPEVAIIMGWSEDDVETLKRRYVSRSAIVRSVLAKLEQGG